MPEFKIPVYWQMGGTVTVEAKNLHDALHKANDMVCHSDFGLDEIHDPSYVEDSITVDEEGALARS